MGNHFDDDQGKTIVCALLVAGAKTRQVKMQTCTHLEPIPVEGNEQIELFLGTHVPPTSWMDECKNPVCIVIKTMPNELRLSFKRETGRVCTDLSPRVKKSTNLDYQAGHRDKLYHSWGFRLFARTTWRPLYCLFSWTQTEELSSSDPKTFLIRSWLERDIGHLSTNEIYYDSTIEGLDAKT
jgi:hypothetical protein